MKKHRKDDSFIKKPVFPGGQAGINAVIKKHLTYPKKALDAKKEGTVHLRYEIDYKGKVTGSKIISSLGYGCDEEAQRLVKLLVFEVPKNPRKMKIKFHKTIRIHFRLAKTQTEALSLAYTTTPAKSIPKSASTGNKPKPSSYSYTISW